MASLRECCEKLPTGTLEDIIFGDLEQRLPQVILTVCDVLLERQPDRLDVLKVIRSVNEEE